MNGAAIYDGRNHKFAAGLDDECHLFSLKYKVITPAKNTTGNFLTLSQMSNFRLFQTGRVSDNNLKFDENGRKFSKRVEKTVGK